MNEPSRQPALFDTYVKEYDAALAQGISVSGEGKEYFAGGRALWLAGRLRQLGVTPQSILDFGCGTGSATPFLLGLPGITSLLGVDVSRASIEAARQQYGSERSKFSALDAYTPSGDVDLAFCNGVFHHIPPAERAEAVRFVHRALRPGGLFAFWENNPWNPGTRLVMSRIPFDRDAITLTAPEARRLLRENGFEILMTDFQFIFPRILKWLRPLERALARLPLGAQFEILCRKAEAKANQPLPLC